MVSFVAQTSDWAQQEEDNTTFTIDEEEEEVNETEASISDWEAEGEEVAADESAGEKAGVFVERDEEEEAYVEPPEDAKIFVGNLPYDVDSQRLAMLFEKLGLWRFLR